MARLDGRNLKKCPKGHALGEIVREIVQYNERRAYATRLRVFRQAVEVDENCYVEMPDVVVVLEGTAPEVFCSICGASVPWVIGKAEIDRLLARWVTRRGLS